MAETVFTRSIEVSIVPTIEELAKAIIYLGSDQQAELISKIAELTDYSVPMQLQYVTDDPGLTRRGRALMRWIGSYSTIDGTGEVRRG